MAASKEVVVVSRPRNYKFVHGSRRLAGSLQQELVQPVRELLRVRPHPPWPPGRYETGTPRRSARASAARRAACSPEVSPAALTIRVDTHGTEDPLFPYEHGVALANEIPGVQLLPLEQTGHELPRAIWDVVVVAILRHPGDRSA
jgi:pimeloyl-ACP methyl ester carboxylesterase